MKTKLFAITLAAIAMFATAPAQASDFDVCMQHSDSPEVCNAVTQTNFPKVGFCGITMSAHQTGLIGAGIGAVAVTGPVAVPMLAGYGLGVAVGVVAPLQLLCF